MIIDILILMALLYLIFIATKIRKNVHTTYLLSHYFTYELSSALDKYVDYLNLLKPKTISQEESKLWNEVNADIRETFNRLKFDCIGRIETDEELKHNLKELAKSLEGGKESDLSPNGTLSRSLMYEWHKNNNDKFAYIKNDIKHS